MFRHPTGEAAKRYNVLQNLAYLVVIFGLLPLIVVRRAGDVAAASNAVCPGWVDLLGGRQSARTLHFLAACGCSCCSWSIHVFEVLIVAGVWNKMRSMITGWYTHAGRAGARRPAMKQDLTLMRRASAIAASAARRGRRRPARRC